MPSARARNDPTLLAKSDPPPHRGGGALPPGKRTPAPLGPPVRTNWLGKNEWVTRNQKHGGGACSFLPAGKCGLIVFFVWVDLSEHKWIIIAERRGLLSGVTLEHVSILLGHSSVKITEKHYSPWVKTRQEKLEEEFKRAGATEAPTDKAVVLTEMLSRRDVRAALCSRYPRSGGGGNLFREGASGGST